MTPTASADKEKIRYSRQTLLREIGPEGQAKLNAASVLLVGLGGLGSPAALYLAAAGVGRLGLADFDVVDLSNLHRQLLHTTERIGQPKTRSAETTLHAINPHVELVRHEAPLRADNALATLRPYDIVVVGADNFATRYLVNDACVLLGKPNVSGSIFQFEGQASVFWAERGPCYRCLHPDPPPPGAMPSCGEAGVLGVLPGVIGLVQATETIKLIVGMGESLIGRILLYDALGMRFRTVSVRKDPACALCGEHASIRALQDYDALCGGPVATEPPADPSDEIDAPALAQRLKEPDLFLLDVRQPAEWDIARLPGATLIPLDALPARLAEVPADRDVVVYCRSGARSRKAQTLLRKAGRRSVLNLAGGIQAWRNSVDPSLPLS